MSTSRVKRLVKRLLGKSPWVAPAVFCSTDFLGSTYGGYCICPDKLGQTSIVYSCGIGYDISFDLGVIEKYGAHVFAFDPTTQSVDWVQSQALPDKFHFHAFGIADYDGTAMFVPPANPDHVSYSMVASGREHGVEGKVFRLASLMDRFGHKRIDVLKLDIEGAEYQVLADLLSSGIDVDQILVEFHHRLPGLGVDNTYAAIKGLSAHQYLPFYVSTSDEEFSFLRMG